MTGTRRWLIVNADDFGLSTGINSGIVEAHERGIATSASLMVRGPAAAEAAAYAEARPELDLGLHADLGEWVCTMGEWRPLYTVVPLDDPAAVAGELAGQLKRFRDLTGRSPTHLDSHQHVHLRQPVRGALEAIALTLGVPLRGGDAGIHYCGAFYGQTADGQPLPGAITAARLVAILASLPPGVSELSCHPGYAEDLETMYRAERAWEVSLLCDPNLRAHLDELRITLTSFSAVSEARRTLRWA